MDTDALGHIMGSLYKTIVCSCIIFVFLYSNVIADNMDNGIQFHYMSSYRSYVYNNVYDDVLAHAKKESHGDQDGRYTNVHETGHIIHSELRTKYKLLFKKRINALYCLNGKFAIIDEPDIKIRHVQKYIPKILQSSRYKIYLIDQIKFWDDTPTYLLDEWNCYLLGAECAVNDMENNLPLEKTNAISGALEFSIYCTALCLAIKNYDEIFWNTNHQFKSFVRYNLIRSEKVFNNGIGVIEFKNKEQDRLQQEFLNHPDAAEIRNFLKSEFDGIFVE